MSDALALGNLLAWLLCAAWLRWVYRNGSGPLRGLRWQLDGLLVAAGCALVLDLLAIRGLVSPLLYSELRRHGARLAITLGLLAHCVWVLRQGTP